MQKFSTFIFESFSFNQKTLKASFFYTLKGHQGNFNNWSEVFEEIIDFKSNTFDITENKLNNKIILNNFLFNLHIALWISYYKLFPTKILEVKSGYLDQEQILFWEKFYRNWLGEFFITNNLDFSELINFKNIWKVPDLENIWIINNYISVETRQCLVSTEEKPEKNLLLWWGWKDSIVSYSILNKENKKSDLFVFWKIDDIKKNTAQIAEKEILLVKRQLSNNLFKLNEQWYYNWHVPITWIIAFVTFVVSYLYWYKNIILSNEKSASEENTTWKDLKINHQYSKSLEFEEDLNNYLHNYISNNINYYSLLRGMYEYKIAEIFSNKWKKFFNSFSSCNRNFKINKSGYPQGVPLQKNKLWCCECEKCCFVFLILSSHLEEKELINIFGENLFEKISLEKTFRELIWLENYKPFECVWTYEESLLSAKKVIINHQQRALAFWIVLKNIKTEILNKCNSTVEQNLEKKLNKIY